jgi:seryl-tRNA synthetase
VRSSGFPRWDALQRQKQQLQDRLKKLVESQREDVREEATELAHSFTTAEEYDREVQAKINTFNHRTGTITREEVIAAIDEDTNFYADLEDRLNDLEALNQ